MNEKTRNFQGEQPTYKKGGKSMKTKKKTLMQNQKGMTLIELLAVIVIIAIIAIIAIPAIGNIINNSRDKAILTEATNIIAGAKTADTDDVCDIDTGCKGSDLKDYVDGIKLTDATIVKKAADAADGYEITYSRFAELKKDKYTAIITDKKTTTDRKINEVLDKKDEKKVEEKK